MQIAIIPARGGSKGIPNKNLETIGSFTLVETAIKCAHSAAISEVYVSSDDDVILDLANRAGAIPIKRPAKIAGDEASSELAILHTLETMGHNYSTKDNIRVAFCQATSPFTDPKDLRAAMDRVSERISIFAAASFHNFLWEQDDSEWKPMGHSKYHRVMRQSMKPTVMETGNFYCFSMSSFISERTRFCGSPSPQLIDVRTALQIDSRSDLEWARKLKEAGLL